MKLQKAHFVFILIFIISLSLFLYFSSPYKTVNFDMYLTVGDILGFNVDNDAIYFGMIPPQGTGSRRIILNTSFPALIIFNKKGELSKWVETPFFYLNEGVSEIKVKAHVPSNAEYGNYTGKLYINFYYLPW